jgi:hypothetical protein
LKKTSIIISILFLLILFSGCSNSNSSTASTINSTIATTSESTANYQEYKGAFLYDSDFCSNDTVLSVQLYDNGNIHIDDNSTIGFTSANPAGNTTYTLNNDDIILANCDIEKMTFVEYKGIRAISVPNNKVYDYNYLIFPSGTNENIISEWLDDRTKEINKNLNGRFYIDKSANSDNYISFENDIFTLSNSNGNEAPTIDSCAYSIVSDNSSNLGYKIVYDNSAYNKYQMYFSSATTLHYTGSINDYTKEG